MLLGKQRQNGVKTAGGLLVFIWTKTGAPVQSLICTGKFLYLPTQTELTMDSNIVLFLDCKAVADEIVTKRHKNIICDEINIFIHSTVDSIALFFL